MEFRATDATHYPEGAAPGGTAGPVLSAIAFDPDLADGRSGVIAAPSAAPQPAPRSAEAQLLASTLAAVEARCFARGDGGAAAWRAGRRLVGRSLDLNAEAVAVGLSWAEVPPFARVTPMPEDPRRFDLAPVGLGDPALLMPIMVAGDTIDVLALSLVRRRFFRLTCLAPILGQADESGELRLRQNPWGFVRQLMSAAGREANAVRQGRLAYEHLMCRTRAKFGATNPEVPMATPTEPVARRRWLAGFAQAIEAKAAAEAGYRNLNPIEPPKGRLVLDPAALDWTRRGMLRRIETIRIMDAQANGALGRALRILNPAIGTARGAALVGLEAALHRRSR